MKKLVEKLGVKRADQREHDMFEHLNDKVCNQMNWSISFEALLFFRDREF